MSVIILAAFAAGASALVVQEAEPPQTTADSDKDIERQMFQMIEKVKQRVAEIRGLRFKDEVKAGILSKDELLKVLLDTLGKEMPDEEIAAYEKVYKKFGLLYPGMNLKKIIVETMTENIAGFYDPEKKELMLIKEPAVAGTAELQKQMLEILLSHELTHALQDQHFNLLEMPFKKIKDNDDFVLATQAVVEGDATLLMLDYMRPGKKSVAEIPEFNDSFAILLATGTMATSPDTPKILMENLIFPYMRGLKFISQKTEGDMWKNIDGIYSDLPTSTEQVLHPDKYFVERDYPVLIKLPDLRALLGEDWKPLLDNNMGELNTGVLLSEFILGNEAQTSAKGWDGDRFAAYERKSDGNIFVVWYTTWDSEADADEFLDSMRKYTRNKYRDDELIDSAAKTFYLWKTGAGYVKLFRKEKDVILIEGAPEDKLALLEEVIMRDTKMTEFRYIPAEAEKN